MNHPIGYQYFKNLAPVVQTMDSAVHRITHYPADNSIGFASVYPLDSDLSGGQRYPSFEQLGTAVLTFSKVSLPRCLYLGDRIGQQTEHWSF